jgi:choice-of-anchor A domain-containing protein
VPRAPGLLTVRRPSPARVVAAVAALLAGPLLGAGLDVTAAAAAATCGGTLGTAQDFNVFIHSTVDEDTMSVGGRSAYGGDSRISNANFGTQEPADPGRVDVIVGASLSFTSGSIENGSGTYAGSATLSGVSTPNGTITQAAPPFDFDTEFSNLAAESSSWAADPANGTVTDPSGAVYLTGTDPTLNIFDLAASVIDNASQVDIKVPQGSTTLINLSGPSLTDNGQLIEFWNGSGYQSAFDTTGPAANIRNATLFNVPDASSITFNNTNWDGSILAPNAAADIMVTGFYGSLIANSLSPTTQNSNYYNDPFTGTCLPPTPTQSVPPSWPGPIGLTAVAGLGLYTAQRRARRRSAWRVTIAA